MTMNDFSFKDFFKDLLEEFSAAYKYAELDFYKLKSEVIALTKKANAKGYGNPDYCTLSIKIVSNFETTALVEAYYNKGNGKYQKFKNTIDIGMLSNIPVTAKNKLDKNGEFEIKLSNFDELYKVSEEDIIPGMDFKKLCNFSLRNAKGTPVRKELHITDEFFYYKVDLVYVYGNGEEEKRVKYFGNILNLPNDVANKIGSDEYKSCSLNVTDDDK